MVLEKDFVAIEAFTFVVLDEFTMRLALICAVLAVFVGLFAGTVEPHPAKNDPIEKTAPIFEYFFIILLNCAEVVPTLADR